MKKGFTLIELMVVVLIIGILSAIALPQYERSIKRSRTAEALVVLKSISNAQQMYLTTFKKCADDMSKLDVNIPADSLSADSGDGKWHFSVPAQAGKDCSVAATNSKHFPGLTLTLKVIYSPYKMCWSCSGDECEDFLTLSGLKGKTC